MKIIVTGAALTGHLNPALAIGHILRQAGHDVVGHAASVFRPDVERHGLAFHAFSGDADVDMRDMDAFFPERKHLPPGPASRVLYTRRIFLDAMPAQYRGLAALLRDFPADLIIAENAFLGTVPLLLGPRRDRPPIVHCGCSYLRSARDDGAPANTNLPPAVTERDRAAYRALGETFNAEVAAPIGRLIDAMLAELDRPPLPVSYYDAPVLLPDLFLQPAVPGFEYPRTPMPPTLRFIGCLPPLPGHFPLPPWAADLDGRRRVVLVTQGTVANHDLGALILPTLEALAGEPDLLVVAATGGRPVEPIRHRIPPNARVAEFLPYDWLMPQVDLFVTNGGYGSVTQALNLGIPLVVAGTTEDKKEVSGRVTWSGVGLSLNRDNPSAAELRQAILRVLGTEGFRSRARALMQEFASYDTRRIIEGLPGELGP